MGKGNAKQLFKEMEPKLCFGSHFSEGRREGRILCAKCPSHVIFVLLIFITCLNEVSMQDMHHFLLKLLKALNQLPGMIVTFQISPSHRLKRMPDFQKRGEKVCYYS